LTYHDATVSIGGTFQSICTGDWTLAMDVFGADIAASL